MTGTALWALVWSLPVCRWRPAAVLAVAGRRADPVAPGVGVGSRPSRSASPVPPRSLRPAAVAPLLAGIRAGLRRGRVVRGDGRHGRRGHRSRCWPFAAGDRELRPDRARFVGLMLLFAGRDAGDRHRDHAAAAADGVGGDGRHQLGADRLLVAASHARCGPRTPRS